jgi:hypothetical protein
MAGDAAHRPMFAASEPVNFVDLVYVQHAFGYKPVGEVTPEGCCWQEAGDVGPVGVDG